MTKERPAMTKLRSLILDVLVEAKEPVKAYDILEAARRKGFKITAATVYRILDYLESNALVHRVSSINAFMACLNSEIEHQPLIVVCQRCRKTTELNDSGLYLSIFERLNELGLSLTAGSVEIRGLCPSCQDSV
ncbi:MAG: transcriptional repressor [Deltaproteobacteria bacterium]|jgi:Fur family zinc uptake transcriptional regulator|nr:transcriptional repressor [Deltaproteobacteria bacterium]